MNSWLAGPWSRTTWVLMLLAVIGLGVGWTAKAPCIDTYQVGNQSALDWRNWRQYETRCYSDIIPLYGVERLQDGDLPYKTGWTDSGDQRTRYMEYPVLTGMLQYGVMRVTKSYLNVRHELTNPDPPEVVTYFTFMAAVLALAWLIAVRSTIPLAGRPRDVALMALSPLIAVQAFTNFDALAVAFCSVGMLAWAKGRPTWSGVMFGLGAAAKLYPLFVLGPLLVLCLRTGKMRLWWRAAAGAAIAWLAVNLPIAALYTPGWKEFFRLNSMRGADLDSIYNAISAFTGWQGFDGPLYAGQTPTKLNLISLGLFAVACLAIGVIGFTARRRPRVASMAFLIVAAFLLTNKVWSPQYSLWLVPLAVLALPRWLPLLAWMSVDAYLWYPRMGYFLGSAVPGHGNSQKQFLTVVLARDLLVVIVCALIVRTIYRPDVDPVRAAGFDDPAGGPLDGAPDRPRWWFGRPGPGLTAGDQAPGDQAPGDQDLADASSPGSRHADTAPDPAPSPRSAW